MNPGSSLRTLTRALLLALVCGACGDPVQPGAVSYHGLELSVSLTPATVGQRDSTRARLTIRNTTGNAFALQSSCTSIASIGLYREGQRIAARGTDSGCFPAITSFAIQARQDLQRDWTIRTEDDQGNALPAGSYTFRVQFQVIGMPELERELRVQ